jgi:L-malate glycosyltransferase
MIHVNSAINLYAGIAAKSLNVPIIYTIREYYGLWPYPILFFHISVISIIAARIICVSEAVSKMFFLNRHKIRVIYNGVDLKEFNPKINGSEIRKEYGVQEDDLLIGVIAGVQYRKGQHMVIEAMREAIKHNHKLKCIFVGYLPKSKYVDSCLNLIQAYDLEDRVIFTGERKDIPQVLNSIDIFILPSFTEAFPRTVIEAAACKKLVIASRVGGIPEIIKEMKTGFLFEPGNQRELNNKLRFVVDNFSGLDYIGENAFQSIQEKFDRNMTFQETQQLYGELFDQKKKC